MKKLFVLFSFLLLSVSAGYADVIAPEAHYFCINTKGIKTDCPKNISINNTQKYSIKGFRDKQTGLYGAKDENGRIVIQPKYRFMSGYSEGLAAACTKNFCGYIDINENWVIQPKYISAGDFKNGIAKVMLIY